MPKGYPKSVFIGSRFGKLTITEIIKELKNPAPKHPSHGLYKIFLKARCDCGNEIIRKKSFITTTKGIRSCGCSHEDINRDRKLQAQSQLAALAYVAAQYTKPSYRRKRRIEGNLIKEQVITIMQQNCFYCGVGPSNIAKKPNQNVEVRYNGMDRIDSNKGYIEGNVVPSCKNCNIAKAELTVDEFYTWAEKLLSHKEQTLKELPGVLNKKIEPTIHTKITLPPTYGVCEPIHPD